MDKLRLIGVDGGGTKTDIVMCADNGEVLQRILTGPSNPNDIGMQAAANVIIDAVLAISGGEFSSLFAGLSGGSTGDNDARVNTLLRAAFPACTSINNSGDAINALSNGLLIGDGCAIIAGTGSIVYARKGAALSRAGGWGYLFDEGLGGFDISRDAITAALRAGDGVKKPTILSELLCRRLGGTVQDKLPELYSRGKVFIASLAPTVFEAYDAHDNVAAEILDTNLGFVAESLDVLLKNFDGVCDVSLAGSLFKRSDVILPILEKKLVSGVTRNYILPETPPVFGAVVEAARAVGLKPDEAFRSAFIKSV